MTKQSELIKELEALAKKRPYPRKRSVEILEELKQIKKAENDFGSKQKLKES